MEPKSSEQLPTPIENGPRLPEYESGTSRPEHLEPTIERTEERPPQAPPVDLSSIQLPTPVVPPVSDTSQATSISDDNNPAAAADEDLIEKEWVDKAKKIIEETKDDPHKQERAVGKLQTDYLKKRYGKELGNQP